MHIYIDDISYVLQDSAISILCVNEAIRNTQAENCYSRLISLGIKGVVVSLEVRYLSKNFEFFTG